MKKLLTFIIFALSFVITYAQDEVQTAPDTVVTTTEVERIIDKYSEKVYNTLTTLITQLKGPAEYIFKSAIKVNIAKGIVNLIPFIIFIPCFILFLYYVKAGRWCDGDTANYQAVLSIIMGIISLGLLIAGIVCICSAIPYLVSPEWYAIQDIMHLIR